MAQTQNVTQLGLNQWIAGDKLNTSQFSEDNLIIESELIKKADLKGADFEEFLKLGGKNVITEENYEVGNFVPKFVGSTQNGTTIYDVQYGSYVRHNNLVWFTVHLVGHLSGYAGTMLIDGLPYYPRDIVGLSVGHAHIQTIDYVDLWAGSAYYVHDKITLLYGRGDAYLPVDSGALGYANFVISGVINI